MLDSENVRLFVWPYYLALLAWGLYATIWGESVSIVEPVMGSLIYTAWVWSFIFGTIFTMTGLLLREGGKPVAEMGPVMLFTDWLGLWMQLGGHAWMGVLLATYEYSGIKGAYWGQAAFSLFLVPPYVLGCVFLSLQTARKLIHAERLNKYLGTER